MIIYSGEILGHLVSVTRELSVWDKGYLAETYKICEDVLVQLPDSIKQEDFVRGMMVILRGSTNPSILKEVYKSVRCKVD